MRSAAEDALGQRESLWSSRIERQYASELRKVALKIGSFVKRLFDGTIESIDPITDALLEYENILTPWAETTAAGVLARVKYRNDHLFRLRLQKISRLLRHEMSYAETGQVMQHSLVRQVSLIKSLPVEAAQRIQNLAFTGYAKGYRIGEARRLPPQATGPLWRVPDGLVKDIMKTGEVTASRANLIARTETTRVSTELTKARAEYVGSTHFIWQTAKDEDVRLLHRRLQGKKFRWDDPPVAGEKGERALPGCIYNCRCWSEPLIPDRIL